MADRGGRITKKRADNTYGQRKDEQDYDVRRVQGVCHPNYLNETVEI